MNARRNSVASKLVFIAALTGAVLAGTAGIALADTHWSAENQVSVTSADGPGDTHWVPTNSVSPADTHWGANTVSLADAAPADTHWGANTVSLADAAPADTHWGSTSPAPADTHW